MPQPPRLQPGDPAPDFTLPDADGHPHALADHRGRRVIVYFYPAASTPGCTREACDFRDSLPALQQAGVDVLGVSPDPPERLRRFRDAHRLPFPLLADPDRAVLTAYGAYGDKSLYGRLTRGVIRSTVVVGPDGRVEWAGYGVRATGHVGRLLRDLGLAGEPSPHRA